MDKGTNEKDDSSIEFSGFRDSFKQLSHFLGTEWTMCPKRETIWLQWPLGYPHSGTLFFSVSCSDFDWPCFRRRPTVYNVYVLSGARRLNDTSG